MGDRGRKKTVSDLDILREFALDEAPFIHPTELTETLDMSRQGIYKRLVQLEDEGLLESKKAADARNWWLTDEGRRYISENS
jgi:predicted transcriptional regulator